MPFTLAPLPYDAAALEPHIDAQTMQIHHGKHHQAYVTNLNTALESLPALSNLSIEALIGDLSKVPEAQRTAVRNNGGGHYNHTLFWELMRPGGAREPESRGAKELQETFGGLAPFKEQFQKAGLGRFGSGWVWLVRGKDGKLAIESTANQDSPVMEGKHAVFGCDVWEHAYYLRYQNRRADYLAAWWNVLNWSVVEARIAGGR
jgi:Fe-Mn family superoxide dismutase